MNKKVIMGPLIVLALFVVGLNISLFKKGNQENVIAEEDQPPVLAQVTVSGTSMEPTLMDGDVFIADISPKVIQDLKRGDIIFLQHPDTPQTEDYLIKRVVGISLDIIEIKYGKLYVNDIYKNYGAYYKNDFGPYTVKEASVFVLGDNAAISLDSRAFRNPSLPLTLVKGRLIETE